MKKEHLDEIDKKVHDLYDAVIKNNLEIQGQLFLSEDNKIIHKFILE